MRAHHALALTPEPFGVFGDLGILGGDRHPDAAELVIDITPNGPEKAPRPSRARQGDVNRCPFKAVEYDPADYLALALDRSEEHTSELQSLMRISYAVFCLKKKKTYIRNTTKHTYTHINSKQH